MIFEVPSNPNHSMILWFYNVVGTAVVLLCCYNNQRLMTMLGEGKLHPPCWTDRQTGTWRRSGSTGRAANAFSHCVSPREACGEGFCERGHSSKRMWLRRKVIRAMPESLLGLVLTASRSSAWERFQGQGIHLTEENARDDRVYSSCPPQRASWGIWGVSGHSWG